MRTWLVILLLVVLETLCLLTAVLAEASPWMFFVSSVGGSVVWVAVVVLAQKKLPTWMPAVMLATGLLMRLTVIGITPVASDDMYRYMWDGKVQAHGIDPYLHAPASDELQELRSDMLPARINFPDMRTVYPPLAQWIFWLTYSAGGESVFVFKIPLLLADALTVLLLLLLLRRLDRSRSDVALYVLHPLVILQFMADGHLDVLAFPFVLGFLLLMHARSRILAAIALGCSIAVKLLSLFYVPLLLRDAFMRRNAWFLLALAVPVLAYLPYALGDGAPFESLAVYASKWSFNGSVYRALTTAFQNSTDSRLVTQLLTVITVGVLALQKRSLIWKVAWSTFAYILFAATVHPWYLTWLVLLLPLYPRWSLITFTATIAIANFSGIWYALSGEWLQPDWMGPVVYLPVLLVLLLEWRRIIPVPETSENLV